MKKPSMLLLTFVLLSSACKDDPEVFGSIDINADPNSLKVWAQPGSDFRVGLFNFNSTINYDDALYVQPLIGGHAQFTEVNPGDYRVIVLGTPMAHGVQVKAGKQSSVTLD